MELFAGYEMMEKLAQGGMSEIFRARPREHQGQDPEVVIKKLQLRFCKNAQAVDLFTNEAHVCTRLKHPNIIRGLAHGNHNGRHFIVMELIDGPNLGSILRTLHAAGGKLGTALSIYVAVETLRGLHHAHQFTDEKGRHLGLIHRDVSPENILTTLKGEIKIGDFGIAKLSALQSFTDPAIGIRGKLAYLAPERTRGEGFDARADQFSAALVLHEMLTGVKAYASESGNPDEEVILKIRRGDVERPRKLASDVPKSLDAAVMKALEKNPKSRFKSCGEFADMLELVARKEGLSASAEQLRVVLQEHFPERYPRAGANARVRML